MKSINKVEFFINILKTSCLQLKSQINEVNELNVFPVPDGDTGTNMYLTLNSALKYIEEHNVDNFFDLADCLSKGALMGARGNSGVILSQIFRGFALGIKNVKIIDGKKLLQIFKLGEEIAYKAVKKPVEGTILTVMRGIKDGAAKAILKKNDFLFVLNESILSGNKMLKKTPNYLPILKEAGVVDAGGKGLMIILEGMHKGILGKSIVFDSSTDVFKTSIFDKGILFSKDIKFIYCTEFIVLNPKKNNENIRKDLEELNIGDSLITIVSDGIAKIHMHTNKPDELLKYSLTIGYITNIKISNMLDQFQKTHNSKLIAQEKEKKIGFVMIVPGKGLEDIAKSMGVDVVLHGGQTMNPSTKDIQLAIDMVNSKIVYIFPNNKNIILASEQASKLTNNKKVFVVPTNNIPEGFNSLLEFNESLTPEENLKLMKNSFKNIVSGAITYAIKDTSIDGLKIKKNEILTIKNEKIIGTNKTIKKAIDLFVKKEYKNYDLLTIYAGDMIKNNDAYKIKEYLNQKYPELEIFLYFGKQSVYYYILSLE